MKVLIFVASHYPYSTESPLFSEFATWLNAHNFACMVSIPDELKYISFNKNVNVLVRSSSTRSSQSLQTSAIALLKKRYLHAKVPIGVWREILWGPDKIFVFSDPFIDFEFYKNTWLYNTFEARQNLVFKVCTHSVLFDANKNTSLIQTHRDSLSIYKKIFFSSPECQNNAEKSIESHIRNSVQFKISNKLDIVATEFSETKNMFCPMPTNCSYFKQDILVAAWKSAFGNRKDVKLILNDFGPDKDYLTEYMTSLQINFAFKRIGTLPINFSGIFLATVFEEASELNQIFKIDDLLIISNLNSQNGIDSTLQLPSFSEQDVVNSLKIWESKPQRSFQLLNSVSNYSSLFEQLMDES